MCDNAALKLLIQIAIHSSSQENDYTLAWIIDIGLKDQTAVVEIGAAWATGDNAPNIQRSAMRFEKIFKIDNQTDIRSSDIRRRIAKGEPFGHLVVPDVARYIKKNKLYQKN